MHRFHQLSRRSDGHRDCILGRLGYRVLRLDARLVLTDIETALARVRAAME